MKNEELTFLVVEDHEFQRRLATGLLGRLGAKRVLEAGDGLEALAVLRHEDGAVDVVLCDLDMPAMDGVEFIRRVAEERLATALVIISALEPAIVDSVERMSRAHGHLVLGTIEKPISAQKLQNVLANQKERSARSEEIPRRFLAADVARGMAAREFEVWFQPKVRLADQTVAGAEALARWRHPEAGVVRPGSFLAVAEGAGLADEICWQVIVKALDARRRWMQEGITLPIAINVSLPFLENLQAADQLAKCVADSGADPKSITFEVTEGVAATNFVNVMENLARLRIKGFGVSIDDYGTGYSSVQQLSRIPYTELKLDQSFVTGAAHKPTMRAILESALQLAKHMKLASVAEGIERAEEWTLLKSLGCDLAQGYYVSMPMPAEEFPDWYRNWTGSLT